MFDIALGKGENLKNNGKPPGFHGRGEWYNLEDVYDEPHPTANTASASAAETPVKRAANKRSTGTPAAKRAKNPVPTVLQNNFFHGATQASGDVQGSLDSDAEDEHQNENNEEEEQEEEQEQEEDQIQKPRSMDILAATVADQAPPNVIEQAPPDEQERRYRRVARWGWSRARREKDIEQQVEDLKLRCEQLETKNQQYQTKIEQLERQVQKIEETHEAMKNFFSRG